MRILVIGAGYVGLATAAVLSRVHQVTIIDIDKRKIDLINSGIPPFQEEGMEPLLKDSVENGRIQAKEYDDLTSSYDFVIVCVGTPPNRDGSVNLDYLESALDSITELMKTLIDDYMVIAIRSTVPPGTTRGLVLDRIRGAYKENEVGVVFNPEFMKQGHAIEDISNPARVVFGASDEKALSRYKEMLKSFIDPSVPILSMSIESAELCKYASNSFLATKVSFANEIASIAEKLPGVDADAVMDAVVMDDRIHPSHLRPGLGYGGTCLPKDVSGLIVFGQDAGVPMDLLRGVESVNRRTAIRLMTILNGILKQDEKAKVAVLGLSFKAGTDDTRKSQSIELIRELIEAGHDVWAHDPAANEFTIDQDVRSKITRSDDLAECTQGAQAVFLMTDWPLYYDSGIKRLMENTGKKLLIDARRLFAKEEIPEDVIYRSLGTYYDTEH